MPHILLYDGYCGFCDRTVQIVLEHDRIGTMRFAALQSPFAERVFARHSFLRGMDSVVVIEEDSDGERVYVKSSAVLRIVSYLGGPWKLLLAGYLIPKPIRDACYDLFARHRFKVMGRRSSCRLPSSEARARFVDIE
jgi:predicted DCC family thiol-disulfide oxidoreductase YuxK